MKTDAYGRRVCTGPSHPGHFGMAGWTCSSGLPPAARLAMMTANPDTPLGPDWDLERVIDTGRTVACDFCGADLTDDPRSGGLLFGRTDTWLAGPCCAERKELDIAASGEGHEIIARLPAGISCADWIRDVYRPAHGHADGHNVMTLYRRRPA